MSPAQLLFLSHCLQACDDDTGPLAPPASPLAVTLSQPAALFLLHWLLDAVDRADLLVPRGAVRVFDEAKLAADAAFPTKLLVEAIGTSLTLVASGVSWPAPPPSSLDRYDAQLLAVLVSDRVLSLLFAVLAVPLIAVPIASPVVGDCGERQGTPMITQQDDLWPFGTRDAVLQLLGNAVCGSRTAQDTVREKGGIELVLNHTKMHPKHPLQREWALFTVRENSGVEG